MSDNIAISTHNGIFEQLVARRISGDDIAWISLMLMLGKSWTVTENRQDNRKNILLSQKQYWKGTYA